MEIPINLHKRLMDEIDRKLELRLDNLVKNFVSKDNLVQQ